MIDFFDIALNFTESEFPSKGEELDLFFKLEIKVALFLRLTELVPGLVVSL